MVDFKIDLEDLGIKEVLAEKILAQLSDESREDIVAKAVEFIIKPDKKSYRYGNGSPIEDSFFRAVEEVLKEIVQDKVSKDETIREKLEELVTEGFAKALDGDPDTENSRENLVEKIGKCLFQNLFKTNNY